MRRALLLLGLVLPLLVVPTTAQARPGTVLETRVIGHSVRGRPIVAYHLGEPGRPVVLVVAAMHGDERAPTTMLRSLVRGAPVRGVDLWVLPTYNPDGAARDSRRNAHGVDLNRNFPYRWKRIGGSYSSGPRPASEPETRAMMGFLQQVRPVRIVSFHQPLHGVDADTKSRPFARRLARFLHLPLKRFECGGACHGTMTMWANHVLPGTALTVEYGAHPSRREMAVKAPRRLLRALRATRVTGT